MDGRRAALSRQAHPMDGAVPAGQPFTGFGLPVTGCGTGPSGGLVACGNLLTIRHRQDRGMPDMIFQKPMFSRPKLASGPCGPLPPSYMSVNHRNIADV